MSIINYINRPAPLAWDVAAAIFGASDTVGGLYDPSSLDTLFQDANGTTPAVPGSPVGLVLDKSEGLHLGPELRGSFTTSGSGASYTPSTGEGTVVRNGGVYGYIQRGGIETGIYNLDIEYVSGPPVQVRAGGHSSGVVHTVGEGRRTLKIAPGGGYLTFNCAESVEPCLFVIHSFRRVAGNHLPQPTTAARPILARMPLTGRRNLLTDTEVEGGLATSGGDFEYTSLAGFERAALFKLPSSTTTYGYINPGAVEVGALYTFSVFVETSDGLPPVFGSSSGGAQDNDFYLNVARNPADPLEYRVEQVRDGLFRVSGTAVRLDNGTPTTGVVRTAAQAAKTGARQFKVTGYQLVPGTEPTPYQHVRSAYDITEEGVPDAYSLVYDLADDALTTTLPQAVNGDILIAGTKGSIIEPVNYAAGSTFKLGPGTYTGGTPGIMRAIGDIVGLVLIDRTLTQTERDVLIEHYKAKGAKGLLVPGPELMPNPDFSDGLNSYTAAGSTASIDVVDGELHFSSEATANRFDGPIVTEVGKIYEINIVVESLIRGTPRVAAGLGGSPSANLGAGNNKVILPHTGTTGSPSVLGNTEVVMSLFSVRELRPQEDW